MAKRSVPVKPLKIGVVQMTSGEDIPTNVAAVMSALEKLRTAKCDLICLPENALYLRIDKKSLPKEAMNLKESFWRKFQTYADETKSVILFGSVPCKKGRKSVNATVAVGLQKKPKIVYEKIHLFDVDVKGAPPARESEHFLHGKKPSLLKIGEWNVGLSICYDIRFAELYGAYARRNAHLILVPAAFLVPTGQNHWHVLLRARAIESQVFVVAAAQCGGHKNVQGQTRETFGHSLVVGPWGKVILDMGNSGPDVAAVTLNPDELKDVHAQIPMVQHRRL